MSQTTPELGVITPPVCQMALLSLYGFIAKPDGNKLKITHNQQYMKQEPQIQSRSERPYVAIRSRLRMQDIPNLLPPLIPEVVNWVQQQGLTPAGPPFFHYTKMEAGLLDIEVGIPLEEAGASLPGSERVKPGKFPAGQYVVTTFMGPYNRLNPVHQALERWGQEKGLSYKGPRTEFYPTDPAQEPDPENWKTIIEIPLA